MAKRNYTFERYPGRIQVVRAKHQPADWHYGAALGWQDLSTKGVDVTEVPGFFGNLFNRDSLPKLASQLRVLIESALSNP